MNKVLSFERCTSIRIFILIFANACAAFGVALCTFVDRGVDPLGLVYIGISNLLKIELGSASLVANAIILLLCFMMGMRKIRIGTIISIISFSIALNIYMSLLSNVAISMGMTISLLLITIGILFMGIGFSIGIHVDIGPSCLDEFLNLSIIKTNYSIKKCKTAIDFMIALIGVLLGATLGIGTVLCVVFVGMVYSNTIQFLESNFPKSCEIINSRN